MAFQKIYYTLYPELTRGNISRIAKRDNVLKFCAWEDKGSGSKDNFKHWPLQRMI